MKYIILGAGPAGLSFANRLLEKGINSFLVIEKEPQAGGLCRSATVDGAPFDIGGGHFLDVRRPTVNKFLFSFMPEEEWNRFDRDSKIDLYGQLIDHPIEANIWQLPQKEQIEYLKSIAVAGCNLGESMPKEFVSWVYWKLGSKIATDYMIPYNKKMFGEELSQLGTYWLEKLPNVSFDETILSCLERRPYGVQPGHAQFYYPKQYGYGELWLRMAQAIKDNIEYDRTVCGIDFSSKCIKTSDGGRYKAETIISTIPWMEFQQIEGMPKDIKDSIGDLKYSSIQTEYFSKHLETKAHWIYYPDPELQYHRILVRHNFCPGSKGFWTETNIDRIGNDDLVRCGNVKFLNQYAYPLNTISKPEIMSKLLTWSREHGVIGLGRWGEHQHYNSDVTVELAMKLCDELEPE